MKSLIRASFAAIALTAVLGVTACGTSAAPAPGVAVDQPSAPPAGVKVKQFQSPVKTPGMTLPAAWDGSGGWLAEISGKFKEDETMFSVGNVIGHITPDHDSKIVNPEYPATKLVVFDGQGNQVYESKSLAEYSESGSKLSSVSKDGKQYLVYFHGGTLMSSATSAKTTKASSMSVTVVDGNGKEVFSKLLGENEYASIGADDSTGETLTGVRTNDAILIKKIDPTASAVQPVKVMDVATGDVSAAPEMAGAKWAGRYDGVDIFRTATGITNGSWTLKGGHLSKAGNLVQAQTFAKDAHGFSTGTVCNVFDPHTGKLNPALGLAAGECIDTNGTSTNGNYIINGNKSVIDVAGGKVYRVGSDLDFGIRSVTNDGTIYGEGPNNYVGHLNMGKDSEPTVEPGKTAIPYIVSDSGLAVFYDGTNFVYLVTKK